MVYPESLTSCEKSLRLRVFARKYIARKGAETQRYSDLQSIENWQISDDLKRLLINLKLLLRPYHPSF